MACHHKMRWCGTHCHSSAELHADIAISWHETQGINILPVASGFFSRGYPRILVELILEVKSHVVRTFELIFARM